LRILNTKVERERKIEERERDRKEREREGKSGERGLGRGREWERKRVCDRECVCV